MSLLFLFTAFDHKGIFSPNRPKFPDPSYKMGQDGLLWRVKTLLWRLKPILQQNYAWRICYLVSY